jgi:hypothetical protein
MVSSVRQKSVLKAIGQVFFSIITTLMISDISVIFAQHY